VFGSSSASRCDKRTAGKRPGRLSADGMVLTTCFAGPGLCLVELGRAWDPIRLGVGGTEPGAEPHPQRGWDCRWLPPTPVREFK
jgi:hypothetical protein